MRSESIALLIAGKSRCPFLKRGPHLSQILGPVRSTSYRLASRIANSLGAGMAVPDWEPFDECEIIVVSMPEPVVLPALDELLDAPIRWKNKIVLLCGSQLDSGALGKFAYVGASTASLTAVPGLEDRISIIEGDRRAANAARRLLEQPGMKVVAMNRGKKALLEAAITFATGMALPLLTASVETLRACGMSTNDSLHVSERLFQHTLRVYSRAGRNGWDGPLSLEDQEAVRRQLKALCLLDPLLASYFFENAHHVVRLFRKDPAWVQELQSETGQKASD